MKFRAVALAVLLGGTAAIAQPVPTTPPLPGAGQWRATTHATGTGYETGTFDQPVDSDLPLTVNGVAGDAATFKLRTHNHTLFLEMTRPVAHDQG